MANPKLFAVLFKLYLILVEVSRSQWVKFGARKNPEAGPYFRYVFLGTLVIATLIFLFME